MGDAKIVSAALKNEQERRVLERAAELQGESLSGFIREAALQRAVQVARSLPEPEETSTTEESDGS